MNKLHNPVSNTRQKGISLVIVLILLVVIGLTSAAAMRGATSSQRVTNNVRMDSIAQQYAEAALRYCEAQLLIPDTNLAPLPVRVNSLKVAVINAAGTTAVDMTVAGALGAWENRVSWTGAIGAGGAAATRTAVPVGQYSTTSLSSYLPAKPPECVVETQTRGSPTFTVTVVTARGFSTDYRADNAGNTLSGAVVWLQSILNM